MIRGALLIGLLVSVLYVEITLTSDEQEEPSYSCTSCDARKSSLQKLAAERQTNVDVLSRPNVD